MFGSQNEGELDITKYSRNEESIINIKIVEPHMDGCGSS